MVVPLIPSFAPSVAQVTSGATAVVSASVSGLAVGGEVAAIIGAIAALSAVIASVLTTNRKNRRDYEAEIRAAEKRGADEHREWTTRAEREAEYWRSIAMGQGRTAAPRKDHDDHEH